MIKYPKAYNFSVRRKKSDSNSWALSYGDMVTTLLCFFIIFYALEKSIIKKEEDQLLADIQHITNQSDTEFNYMIKSLEKIDGLEVAKTSDFMDIYLKKTIFFEKGKTNLTTDGQKAISQIMSVIKTHDKKYIMEIQGHADSSVVKKNKSRWWNSNMEISVLRALNVYKYLVDNEIDKERLIVAGHGARTDSKTETEIEESYKRKISLRMHFIK